MPHNTCAVCGAPATSRQALYCAEHRAIGRQRAGLATSESNRRRWAAWRVAGVDPTHGGEATAKRSAAISESNRMKPRKAKRRLCDADARLQRWIPKRVEVIGVN